MLYVVPPVNPEQGNRCLAVGSAFRQLRVISDAMACNCGAGPPRMDSPMIGVLVYRPASINDQAVRL